MKIISGAERLVKHLHKHKVPIAVATSSGERSVRAKTFHHQELFRLFSHMVMASSDPTIKLGKPAPDVFLACASRFPDKPKPTKVKYSINFSYYFCYVSLHSYSLSEVYRRGLDFSFLIVEIN